LKKNAIIDLSKCEPGKCSPDKGKCLAAVDCKKKILEQEEKYEPPMLMSESMCTGCGDCVNSCPLNAIRISSGSSF